MKLLPQVTENLGLFVPTANSPDGSFSSSDSLLRKSSEIPCFMRTRACYLRYTHTHTHTHTTMLQWKKESVNEVAVLNFITGSSIFSSWLPGHHGHWCQRGQSGEYHRGRSFYEPDLGVTGSREFQWWELGHRPLGPAKEGVSIKQRSFSEYLAVSVTDVSGEWLAISVIDGTVLTTRRLTHLSLQSGQA